MSTQSQNQLVEGPVRLNQWGAIYQKERTDTSICLSVFSLLVLKGNKFTTGHMFSFLQGGEKANGRFSLVFEGNLSLIELVVFLLETSAHEPLPQNPGRR